MSFNSFNFNSPCKVNGKPCEDRHIGCQGTCEKLKRAQEEWTKGKDKKRKENAVVTYSVEMETKHSKKGRK